MTLELKNGARLELQIQNPTYTITRELIKGKAMPVTGREGP
jgi:hypothetical protein